MDDLPSHLVGFPGFHPGAAPVGTAPAPLGGGSRSVPAAMLDLARRMQFPRKSLHLICSLFRTWLVSKNRALFFMFTS